MTPTLFILGCLVTWRLSLLVSQEDGPAYILRKLRRLPPPHSNARKGLSCPWCVSIYAGLLLSGWFWYMNFLPAAWIPFCTLAFSAGAIALHQQFTKT